MKEKVIEITRNYVILLFETIYNWILEKRMIRKQYVREYRSLCIKLLMDDVDEKEGIIDELEEFYYKLQIYAGDFLDSEEKQQAFWLGEMMSVYETYSQHAEFMEQGRKKTELVTKYQNRRNRQILLYIKLSQNGLRHKELAQKCGITASQLTQILGRLREDNTFYSVQRGREKYYILTSLGKTIYDQVCRPEDTERVAAGAALNTARNRYMNEVYDGMPDRYVSIAMDYEKSHNKTRKEKTSIFNESSNKEEMLYSGAVRIAAALAAKRKIVVTG